ncbi:MAG: Glu/Leu/Phe/Val dehydrogenase [Gemmatimonadales bacterium]|jgi:leucine dehydrogenase|nr:MAG: Glu/Leu/Phe/Val dehydrogenase [Gemmatimonadales bacterium]
MEIFERMAKHRHEQLVFWSEPELGYKGIIAIHDTTLGPALGGTRFWNYQTEEAAIVDALRLARGMSYKAAVAGLNLGGGKSVIIGDNKTPYREMIFRAHGRAVESLGGRYITAEDVGTSPDDMEYVLMETDSVVGIYGRSGDPSPVTAYGVYMGIKAAAKARYGDDSLDGKHVAVQGLGHVGYYLCEDLHQEGARLTVTDIDAERVRRCVDDFGATAVEPDEIYGVDADIFAPCALGSVINDDTLKVFKFDIIGGAANNQLARSQHGDAVANEGILYAPDYVINAGGLINVYGELKEWSPERSKRKAGEIYTTLLQIFERAEAEGVPTAEAADRVAETRIERARHLQRSWV